MIDTLPLGEIGWQHAPLDPTFGHIKDGIEYCPHTQGARSSTAFGGWDHIFDPLPFLVGQVAWIYFFVHIPILHNPRRLFRQALKAFTDISLTIIQHAAGEDILRRLTPLSALQEDILQRLGLGASLYGQLEIQEMGT